MTDFDNPSSVRKYLQEEVLEILKGELPDSEYKDEEGDFQSGSLDVAVISARNSKEQIDSDIQLAKAKIKEALNIAPDVDGGRVYFTLEAKNEWDAMRNPEMRNVTYWLTRKVKRLTPEQLAKMEARLNKINEQQGEQ